MKLKPVDSSDEEQDESDKETEQEQDETDSEKEEESERDDLANMSLGGGLKKIKLAKLKSTTSGMKAPTTKTTAKDKTTNNKYPSIEAMVMEAITKLNERNGSSVHAITKYMKSMWPVENENRRMKLVRKVVKAASIKGDLTQIRLSFKLSAQMKKKDQDTKRAEAKKQAKEIKAKEKLKGKEEKKAEKETVKKVRPAKRKKTESTESKSPVKRKAPAKVAAKTTTKTKTVENKKANVRKSIGSLRMDVAKPSVKKVKSVVAGGKKKKNAVTDSDISEESSKENDRFESTRLEPVAAAPSTKKTSVKATGKTSNRNRKLMV